jgi:hypothetical protein
MNTDVLHIYNNTLLNSSSNKKYFMKLCTENQNTHLLFSIFFRNLGSLWNNLKRETAGQVTDVGLRLCMRFAYWVTESRDAHWQYVIITAVPLQQWLHESASMLRFTYIAFMINDYRSKMFRQIAIIIDHTNFYGKILDHTFQNEVKRNKIGKL